MKRNSTPITNFEARVLKLALKLDAGVNSLADDYHPDKRDAEITQEQEQRKVERRCSAIPQESEELEEDYPKIILKDNYKEFVKYIYRKREKE
jgi:hypothetical protein